MKKIIEKIAPNTLETTGPGADRSNPSAPIGATIPSNPDALIGSTGSNPDALIGSTGSNPSTPTGATRSNPAPPEYDVENCPVRQVLDRFADKWSTLVLILLGQKGILRFNELSHAIGDISQKMLTVTLRSLEADGLITRKMYPEIPPRVEYDLTPLGASLLPLIQQMTAWADANIDLIKKNRARYASNKVAG